MLQSNGAGHQPSVVGPRPIPAAEPRPPPRARGTPEDRAHRPSGAHPDPGDAFSNKRPPSTSRRRGCGHHVFTIVGRPRVHPNEDMPQKSKADLGHPRSRHAIRAASPARTVGDIDWGFDEGGEFAHRPPRRPFGPRSLPDRGGRRRGGLARLDHGGSPSCTDDAGPGQPQMKANTALSLLLLGAAGCLRHRRRPHARRASWRSAVALMALAIGLGTTIEYATGRDLGIDQLLFERSAWSRIPAGRPRSPRSPGPPGRRVAALRHSPRSRARARRSG